MERPAGCRVTACPHPPITAGFCYVHARGIDMGAVPDDARRCAIDGCPNPPARRGWCWGHWHRWRAHGDPLGGQAPRRAGAERPACSIDGCDAQVTAKGLCDKHYQRLRRHGDPTIRFGESVREGARHDGCSICGELVDRRGWCSSHYYRWKRYGDPLAGGPRRKAAPGEGTIHWSGYRVITRNGRKVAEHRAVMEEMLGRALRADENVHHINGDRLDNRPGNLELWMTSQPSGQRVSDQLGWALELLGRYLPEALAREVPLPIDTSEQENTRQRGG